MYQDYLGLGRRRPEDEEVRTWTTTIDAIASSSTSTEQFRSQTSSSSSTLSLSSLPSSFTTFLLGLFDSPAYANLTTSYLTETFNPRTPDDPRVRYFSVAGRLGALNIWHPLWFPKVVLDSNASSCSDSDGGEGGGGNDGLVSVESARWGEFLGTLEGADHWALRGASGLELDVDFRDAWGFALGRRREDKPTPQTKEASKDKED